MSLVNDALKRADEEKGQRLAGVTPPGPPAADPCGPQRPWLRRLVIPLCLVVVAAGLLAYGAWWAAGRFLAEASAAVDDMKQQAAGARPAAAPAAPLASTVRPHPTAPAERPATPQPKATAPSTGAPQPPAQKPHQPIAPELVKQVAKRRMSEMNPGAGAGPAPTAGGKVEPSPSETAAPPPDSGPHTTLKVPQAGATPHTRPEGTATQAGGGAKPPQRKGPPPVAPKTAHARKPAPPAPTPQPAPAAVEAKPKPPAAPVDTSHLKVSSIVWGPQGGTAIINGRPVRVGDTVGGATITKITPRSVELEIGGRRVMLALG